MAGRCPQKSPAKPIEMGPSKDRLLVASGAGKLTPQFPCHKRRPMRVALKGATWSDEIERLPGLGGDRPPPAPGRPIEIEEPTNRLPRHPLSGGGYGADQDP